MNVASIDIGTNTVILLIAEVDARLKSIKPIVNEYRMPRIGKGLKKGEDFDPEKIKLLYNILAEYVDIIKRNNCKEIIAAGTNAFRIAGNSNKIIREIEQKLNIQIQIVEKEKEAELSYLGTTFQLNNSENTVIDIGGGSTEIAYGKERTILFRKSFPVGVVSLTEKFLSNDPPSKDELTQMIRYIQEVFNSELNIIPPQTNCIAVAGTPTSLAAIKSDLTEYEENIVDGSVLTLHDLDNFIDHFMSNNSSQLAELYPNILLGREDIILSGNVLLRELINFLKLKEVTVSTKGIRYGLIADYILNNFRQE